MKSERIGSATIFVLLTLALVSEDIGAQQSEPTVAMTPADPTSRTEMPQVLRDGLIELRLDASPLTAQRVAEPIQVRLVFDAPEGSQVTMPIVGSSLGQLDVVGRRLIKALPIDGEPTRRRWTFLMTLESIESGAFIVPSMEILYRLPDAPPSRSTQQSIRSESFAIEVTSLLGEDQDLKAFRDIKEAIEPPEGKPPGTVTRWIVLGIGFSALALLGGFWWWRRDRTPTPFDWARSEIATIDSRLASSSTSLSEAYADLSSVLRRFLECQLGFPATTMSSDELREELNASSLPSPTIAQVTQFLSEADEVKFSGRSRPLLALTDSPADCVREIVQQIHQMSITNAQGE